MSIFKKIQENYQTELDEISIKEYLALCKEDPKIYHSAHQRILNAIGEPEMIDTNDDPQLRRIFSGKKIKCYPAFSDFYGMEETIEQIVNFFRHGSQGLEERKQVLYLLGPVGGGKCHKKGTKIQLSDGSIKNIEDIQKGDTVISSDEYGYNISKKVFNTFIIEPKEVVNLSTRRGLEISGAETHNLLTNNGWKPISDLKVGDFISTSRKTTFGHDSYDINYTNTLAYLLGDEYLPKNSNISFSNINKEIIDDFKKGVTNMGLDIRHQLDSNRDSTGSYRIKEGREIPFRNWIEEIGLKGKKSYNKFIPEFIFTLNKELISNFLTRLYSTDGWATVGSRCEIGYCTTSKKMSKQIVILLSKFGISARISSKIPKLNGKEYRKAYQILIKDKNDIKIFLSEISIIGKSKVCESVLESINNQNRISSSLDRLPKNMVIEMTNNTKASKKNGTSRVKYQLRTELDNNKGSQREFAQSAALVLECDELSLHANNHIYWDEIKSIEYTGIEETMYDFEVEGLHNYIANGIISHNSSIAERLKQLMEETSFYVLKHKDDISPVNESPLGLFSEYKEDLLEEYNVPIRYVPACMSPWAIKRLQNSGGDINSFRVVKIKLSIQQQIGISKTEPGDENNQDITALVGKVELRKLDRYSQGDPDAYSFSGALCKSNQGLMEFVEMFKAPIKMLHPLLTATQEGNYMGSEAISAIPFNGILIAHSNESEWDKFSADKKNEAFLDRINLIRVPYCLRLDEEIKIYEKLISNSELKSEPIAPKTLELLSTFTILTRIKETDNSTEYSKLRVYNGENLKEVDTQAKSLEEYKNFAGITEGMNGISTRFAFKVLSNVFNYDQEEIGANPIHLFYVLDKEIKKLQLPTEKEEKYLEIIESDLKKKYLEFITDEIQKAYVDSYHEYGQNLFDRYILYADNWISDQDYTDPQTGEKYNRESLNQALEKIEKPAGISNAKDFRNDIVTYYFRVKAKDGKSPKWDSYEKIKSVIEKKIFSATEEILPVISYGDKKTKEDKEKHVNFVNRMTKRGYTQRQIRLLVDWYLRARQKN